MMVIDSYRFPPAALPASRYLRLKVTRWFFAGNLNTSGAGDIRVQELEFVAGVTSYPTSNMTNNTSPSPLVATSSGALLGFGDHEPYRAFDGSYSGSDTQWMGDGTVNKYLQIDLGDGNGITPSAVIVTPDNAISAGDGYWIGGFDIVGSNTGSFTGEETLYFSVTDLLRADWTNYTPKTFTF